MGSFHKISASFSFGEIDPKLQAQVGFVAYEKAVKTAKNVISIPQGGFTRRFGTKFVDQATVAANNNADLMKLFSYEYDDKAVYLLLFELESIKIYLENTLVATVTPGAGELPGEIVRQLNFTVVDDRLIILHKNFAPRQLVRTNNASNAITGVSTVNNTLTITNALTADLVLPVSFTTGGTLPVTIPQILVNTTYYAKSITTTTVALYDTPQDAASDTDRFNVTATGTGNAFFANTWTLSNIAFSNLPAFDFDAFATYSASGFTFTASATSGTVGTPLTITASAAVFTAAHVGGLFIGNGGVMRITVFTDTTHVNGFTYENFTNNSGFPGREAFLGEPAWSDARGYPSVGTFFQQRLILAASREIPQGVWGSTIFAAYDFDDSQSLDDNAISYYPAAGQSNFVKGLTSSKSLIVHSNTGNYSTPLTIETPLTPSNFSLTEQNKDGITDIPPVFLDNHILYVDKSSENVKVMSWDIVQSSYVNTNIGVMSSNLIKTPRAMGVYSEPSTVDGEYAVLVNEDGSMAIYNSLVEQDIRGWTRADIDGSYRDVTASLNRAWVLSQRNIGNNDPVYIEELDFDVRADSSVSYDFSVATDTLTGLGHLNGETVQVYGDGANQGEHVVGGGSITIDNEIITGFAGLGFESLVEPLPVNVQMQNGMSLYLPVHIRNVYIHYFESIAMTVQGFAMPVQEVQDVVFGATPTPQTGVFEYTLMEGWDSFEYTIQITQNTPMPMTLLAVGYDIEV